MTREEIFLTNGQLRPIWRFFLSLILIVMVFIGVDIVLGIIFGLMGHRPPFFQALLWAHLLTLPGYLGVFKLLTAAFEAKPLAFIGLAFHRRWKRELGLGLGLGAVMVLMIASLERGMGLATFSPEPAPAAGVLKAGSFYFILLFVAATNEELAFRGYAFQRLVESIGAVGAIVFSSVLFGIIHWLNPHHTWLSTLNTGLVGVAFAIAYLRTHALWLPIGLHFAWNFVMAYCLGLPVSGLVIPSPILKSAVHGAAWLTGLSYGPEGSLLATLIILGVMAYLMLAKSVYTSEEMKALVFGPASPTTPPETTDVPPPSVAD